MGKSESKWVATDCTICYHSCGMNVLVEDGRIVKVEGLKDHPLNKGQLCPKGDGLSSRPSQVSDEANRDPLGENLLGYGPR
jgi:anaerobic selenocysteine-containing dehydrogenase